MELALISLLSLVIGFILGNISRSEPVNIPLALKKSFNIKSKTTISSPSQKKEQSRILDGIPQDDEL